MMKDLKSWQYDEFQQVGRDYGNPAEVQIYDSTHADFRDVEAESNQLLDLLRMAPGDVLIDFGSGTGTFAMAAARRGARVHAVDVSWAMLDYAKAKAVSAGISNIFFSHAGFLTYKHFDQPAAAIATTFALHHLPDFWKGIALARMHSMLRTVPLKTSTPLSRDNQLPGEISSRTMRKATFSKNIQPMTGSWTGSLLAQDSR